MMMARCGRSVTRSLAAAFTYVSRLSAAFALGSACMRMSPTLTVQDPRWDEVGKLGWTVAWECVQWHGQGEWQEVAPKPKPKEEKEVAMRKGTTRS